MKAKIITLIFIVFTATNLFAQGNKQIYYGSNQGFWSFEVKDQYIWIATGNGLCKIDTITKNVVNFNKYNSKIPFDEIQAVHIDKSNTVWILNWYGGIGKFDGINWTQYPYPDNKFYLNYGNCTLLDTSGNLWFISRYDALVKFDGSNFTVYDTSNSNISSFEIIEIALDSATNSIWLSRKNSNILTKFDNGNFTDYTIPPVYTVPSWVKISVDNSGNVWCYLPYYGIAKFDGSAFHLTPTNYYFSALANGSAGNWFRYADTLYRFDNNSLTVYHVNNLFYVQVCPGFFSGMDPSNARMQLYDNKIFYNLWGMIVSVNQNDSAQVAIYKSDFYKPNITLSRGISVSEIDSQVCISSCSNTFQQNIFIKKNGALLLDTNFTLSNNDQIVDVAYDHSGKLWALGNFRLYKYNGTSITGYGGPWTGGEEKRNLNVDLNNHIWFSNSYYNNVWEFDGTNFITNHHFMNNLHPSIYDMCVAPNGNVWVAHSMGASSYNGSYWRKYTVSNSILSSANCIAASPSNKIWFGGGNKLIRKSGSTFTTFSAADIGIDSVFDYIYKICCSKTTEEIYAAFQHSSGNLWPEGGLIHYDGSNWEIIKSDSSLKFSPVINDMLLDYNNNLWLLNYNGINGAVQIYYPNGYEGDNKLKISGNLFFDFNSDGIKDSLDGGIPFKKLQCSSDSTFAFSNNNGDYVFRKDSGSYLISPALGPAWTLTSDSSSYSVQIDYSDISNLDFGFHSNLVNASTSINLQSGIPRCNTSYPVWVNTINYTNSNLKNLVRIAYNPLLNFTFNTLPDSVVNNIAFFSFNNQLFQNFNHIEMFGSWSGGSTFGDTASVNVTSDLIDSNDIVIASSQKNKMLYHTCSYDPNDKSVEPPGLGNQHQTLKSDTLNYTIRFQNLGNDTAFNITIVDTLDQNLDAGSFEITSSSHNVFTEMKNGNVVVFNFPDILLPCNQTNPPESQGYVSYSIKPLAGLTNFTRVENKAFITFDFNPPIATNTTFNILVDSFSTAGIKNITPKNFEFLLYPNPAQDYFQVQLNSTAKKATVKIYNALGVKLAEEKLTEIKDFKVSTSQFKNGMYFLMITNNEGVGAKQKFIVQH